jgi:hypothetical protein
VVLYERAHRDCEWTYSWPSKDPDNCPVAYHSLSRILDVRELPERLLLSSIRQLFLPRRRIHDSRFEQCGYLQRCGCGSLHEASKHTPRAGTSNPNRTLICRRTGLQRDTSTTRRATPYRDDKKSNAGRNNRRVLLGISPEKGRTLRFGAIGVLTRRVSHLTVLGY